MHNRHIIRSVIGETIRSNMALFIFMLLVAAASVATGILPPLVLGEVVDRLTAGSGSVLYLAIGYFLLNVLNGFTSAGKEGLITIFGQKVTHHFRSRMCSKLSRMPASVFTRNAAGAMTSRMVGDVDTVEELFASGVISMAADAARMVGIIAVIFTKSPGLGIMLLIALPLLYLFTRYVQKSTLAAQKEHRAASAQTEKQIPETLQNMRAIHLFGREKYFEKSYADSLEAGFRAVEKSNFYDAFYSPVIFTVSAVLIAIMMTLSAQSGAAREFFGMSVGTAVAVIALVGEIFGPLESIGLEIQNIQEAAASVERIREFLSTEEIPSAEEMPEEEAISEEKAPENAAEPEAAAASASDVPAVEFSDVCFHYDSDPDILTGFSMQVMRGENITITGRTGSGKSTLMRLLLGLYTPSSGTVRLFGQNPAVIQSSQKRSLYGYVQQQFQMIPGSVLDQITLGDPSVSREDAEWALQLTGLLGTVQALPEGIDTPCTQAAFSNGQFQLLSIARAIVKDPQLLLLDEITANLDAATEARISQALQNASQGRTVLTIAHRKSAVRQGRIVRIGNE